MLHGLVLHPVPLAFAPPLSPARGPSLSLAHLHALPLPLRPARAPAQVTVCMQAALPAAATASFFQLLLAFISGGLFFSTVLAAAAAAYTFGVDNLRRLSSIVSVVLQRVLRLAAEMLAAAWTALTDDGARGRARAWRALRDGFAVARKAAVEGAEALRFEASLYAAAIGAPGLQPLQYVLDRALPRSLLPAMEGALTEALTAFESATPNVKRARLTSFALGPALPKLLSGRLYDVGPDTLAMDLDIEWHSHLAADIDLTAAPLGARVPCQLRNLAFDGTVRVLVTNLSASSPGYGALLLSLPAPPRVGLDMLVAGGELTRVPWLRSGITKALQQAVSEELLWPRRVVVPAGPPVPLSASQLESLKDNDPLRRAELMLAAQLAAQEALSVAPAQTKASTPKTEWTEGGGSGGGGGRGQLQPPPPPQPQPQPQTQLPGVAEPGPRTLLGALRGRGGEGQRGALELALSVAAIGSTAAAATKLAAALATSGESDARGDDAMSRKASSSSSLAQQGGVGGWKARWRKLQARWSQP